MDYVTIERVPLMRVGTWNASTGTTSISREDIDNILASFNAGVDPAVIKIGHVDPRFANPEWMDGEPAYGQVTNLSVDDELGGTLYGDYVNVPKELAERMDSAYPFRSVEISWGVQMLDAEGEVTAEYPAVLTALALLGEAPPAVQGLGTVHATFSQRGKTKTTVFTASAFTFAGGHTQDSLRRALQKALEAGGAYDRWVRDFDDSLVWFESEAGLQQVAFLTAPDGGITLTGDVVPVIEKVIFQPVAPPASDTASVPHAGFTANESDTTATPVRAVDQATEGEATMAFTEKHLQVLRSKFGLSATATEDEVLAALEAEEVEAEAAEPAAPAAEQTPAAPAAPAAEDAEDAEEDAEQAPETDAVEPTPAVKLSAANFAAMQEQNRTMAAQLQAITDERDKERRDGIVASAFRAGKLHKTEREAWRKALDENEAVTVSLLDARAAMFSTRERGSDVAPFSMDAGEALTEAQIAAENALFKIGGTK